RSQSARRRRVAQIHRAGESSRGKETPAAGPGLNRPCRSQVPDLQKNCIGNSSVTSLLNRMRRLDIALVERGLCESREKAKRAIMAGEVLVNDQLARKASDGVRDEDSLALIAGEKYVSRGGEKLEGALREFGLDVSGQTAL